MSVYVTSNTSIGGINPPYKTMDVNVSNMGAPSPKMFCTNNYLGSPYSTDEVSEEFIRRLLVYTDAMLTGDIKNISSEYLFAVRTAMQVLQYTRRPLSPERIEQLWNRATKEDGHMAENFAKELHQYITRI